MLNGSLLSAKLKELLEVYLAKVIAYQYGEVTIQVERGRIRRVVLKASVDYDTWSGVPRDAIAPDLNYIDLDSPLN